MVGDKEAGLDPAFLGPSRIQGVGHSLHGDDSFLGPLRSKARKNRLYPPGRIKLSPWATPIRFLEHRYARREIA
jgi:hypothetical protein